MKISQQRAQSIGIAVDHRRHNKSEKSFKINVQRLKEYLSKVVILPRQHKKKDNKPKSQAPAPDLSKIPQIKGEILPLRRPSRKVETFSKSDINPKATAFGALRKARANARLIGIRKKRQKKKAEKAALEAQKKQATS